MKKINLLYDSLRSPYDVTLIYQIALALDAQIYTSGSTIDLNSKKIKSKIGSWNIKKMPEVIYLGTFEEAVKKLHNDGLLLVGTSGAASKSFYEIDCSKGNVCFVYGTETTGLIPRKQLLLDDMVKLPMSSDLDFLTLPVVTSAMCYEAYRQIYGGKLL